MFLSNYLNGMITIPQPSPLHNNTVYILTNTSATIQYILLQTQVRVEVYNAVHFYRVRMYLKCYTSACTCTPGKARGGGRSTPYAYECPLPRNRLLLFLLTATSLHLHHVQRPLLPWQKRQPSTWLGLIHAPSDAAHPDRVCSRCAIHHLRPSECDDVIRRAHVSRSRGQQATAPRGR